MARLNERGRNILTLRSVRDAADTTAARRVIADALPPLLASVLAPEQLELMRQKLSRLPEPRGRPGLTRTDALGAIAVVLLVFLSTFSVVIPFMFIDDARFALRLSNAIAIAMLFRSFSSLRRSRPRSPGAPMRAAPRGRPLSIVNRAKLSKA